MQKMAIIAQVSLMFYKLQNKVFKQILMNVTLKVMAAVNYALILWVATTVAVIQDLLFHLTLLIAQVSLNIKIIKNYLLFFRY